MWENDEVARCVTTRRPLTHSLDLGEEGLAVQATRICSITDCDRPHYGRGFCRNHHNRLIRHGDPLGGKHYNPGAPCSIEGCEKPARARGWCIAHWERWSNNGDPLITLIGGAALPGSQNIKWQGEEIGYTAAHDRVRKARGPARNHKCTDCGKQAHNWSYDHLDPDERIQPGDPKQMPYSAKVEHYQPRCLSCHWKLDRPAAGKAQP